MLAKRIIPCLDVKMGRVVKGVNFVNFRDVGDPVEIAKMYIEQGADELVFLDITATNEGRKTMIDVVKRTAKEVSVPFTVGGGISTVNDISEILEAGADKVSINSAAVRDRSIISKAADKFGSQGVVLAIDAKRNSEGGFNVVINGGLKDTGLDVVEWAVACEKAGAGEILLTSMDADGTKDGFDLELLDLVCKSITIPVIASGGCGSLEHFKDLFEKTDADAALAASLFHYGELTVKQVKEYLNINNITVRL